MKKRWLKIVLYVVALLILGEIALRLFLDNENRVVYLEDDFCEYRMAPDQNLTRFHNVYQTNSYGMRSENPDRKQKKRILLFGDSVLNGGTKMDQQDVLNYILDERLETELGYELGVFNISAGSWGPENAYQFMQHYVDFEFDLVVLVFSSHDYHDNMHFRKVVGIEPAWPADQPYLALTDLYSGYISPKFESWFGSKYDYLKGFDDSAINPGWNLFIEYTRQMNKNLLVYHHPDTDEVKNKTYTADGILLQEMLTRSNVPVIDGLGVESESDFLDNIHVTKNGHLKMATAIFDKIISDSLLAPIRTNQ
ncbi:MAG: hypothetical protein HYZ14_06220 [Bacteroidetes bacterium]|nr:hypothetical protein [Bacteroidota bacterium]